MTLAQAGGPRTEARLLAQILPCLFCSRGKCLGADIMLLCGLNQAGPSAGLEQRHCQTLTRQVRGLMTGAVSCLQNLHAPQGLPGEDAWIRGPLPFPGDSWEMGGAQRSLLPHPSARRPSLPRHSAPSSSSRAPAQASTFHPQP